MGVAAPVARQVPQTAPSRASSQAPVVPFAIASLRRVRQGFDTGNLAFGQNVSAIELPAAGGYLRYLEMVVSATAAGNAAAVAFNADAPFNVLSFIEFLPPSGDPPIVPHTGYQIMLWNKYGAFSQAPPYSDPRRDPGYTAVTGAGATGGSFSFTIRLPFEIDPATGFGSITNSAANKSYLINLTVAPSANVYTTPPTTLPSVRVIGWMYYWDEPMAQTRQGTQQDPGPIGLGSFSQLRIDAPPVTSGDKYLKVNNAGPVLRALIAVLRASNGTRASVAAGDIPQLWDFVFNTRDRFLISDSQLVSDMAEAFGYGLNYGAGLPAADAPNGLDTSVRTFPYFNDFGGVSCINPRTQYQVTADATLTQLRGVSFGATPATVELLTNLIRPTSAGALYDRLK